MEESVEKIEEIRKAVSDYYYALDNREHGGVAQDKAFKKIEEVLGMSWKQGEEKARRDAESW